MASPRFNNGSERRAISHPAMGRYSQWIRLPEVGSLHDSKGSHRKRIFAIVLRPIPTNVKGKTIRRIVIFDNHPDSLRIVLGSGMKFDAAEAVSGREKRMSIICGSILIAMVLGAMLWPLLW
jgi:hypothetical protein